MKKMLLWTFLIMLTFDVITFATACSVSTTVQKDTMIITQNVSSPPQTQSIWRPSLVLQPIIPPEGSVSLPGGIKISPSTASPWPEIPVYENVYSLAEIKTNGEFSIGLDINTMLGVSWAVGYDKSVLSLISTQMTYFDNAHMMGTQWFLFKAITKDYNTTSVTFDLVSLRQDNKIIIRLPFGINVVK